MKRMVDDYSAIRKGLRHSISLFMSLLLVLLMGTGCDGWLSLVNRVERNGLAVEFAPTCTVDGISLAGSLENISPKEKRIKSGSLPWQYDVLGTQLVAEAAGRFLQRNESAPMFGRTGPIDLAPKERRSGTVPIGLMFPEIRSHLASGQLVTVRWKYRVSNAPPEVIEGMISIKRDPCAAGSDDT